MSKTNSQIQRGGAEAHDVWGVCIFRDDGTCFLACGEYAAPILFWGRGNAVDHRRELRENGFKKTAVVRVSMAFVFQPPPRFRVSALKPRP
jgi:hypothetical protein